MDSKDSLLITRTSKSWLSDNEQILILECANSGEIIFKEFGNDVAAQQIAHDLFPDLESVLYSASVNFSEFFRLDPFFSHEFTLRFGSYVSEESRHEIRQRFKFLLTAPIGENHITSSDFFESEFFSRPETGSFDDRD